MPRPKLSDDNLVRELRITPPDGQPIVDWKVTSDIVKLVAFQEGGGGTNKALHYHCLIEYTRSRELLVKWIYTIAHCYNGETGNAVFFTRKPHKNTCGYIAKSGNVAYRHNYEQTTLEQWFNDSEDYLKSKEAKRKQKQRTREEVVYNLKKNIQEQINAGDIPRSPGPVLDRIISEFNNNNLALPNRNAMELLIATCMGTSFLKSYYLKNLSFV